MMIAAFREGSCVASDVPGVADMVKPKEGPREAPPRPLPMHGVNRLGRGSTGEHVKASAVLLTSPVSSASGARLRIVSLLA